MAQEAQPTVSQAKIAKIKVTLDKLNEAVRQATDVLNSAELAPEIDRALHDADNLPDRDLAALARLTVDTMESLQLQLTPSMTLLADGFFGYMNSKAMAAIVQAKVPNVLHEHGPLTAEQLGAMTKIQPVRLTQLLDALVNNGIFSYDADSGKFANNRCSTLLRSDHWTQWHLWADLYPNFFFDVSRSIPQAIRQGETRYAAQIEFGTELPLFEYLAQQGKSEYFHRVLGAGAVAMAKGLTVDYPWQELSGALGQTTATDGASSASKSAVTVVDLGAGSGDFLASVLREHPSLHGTVVDLKHVVDVIGTELQGTSGGRFSDLAGRMSSAPGDFFGAIPRASVYTIKWCLHNWVDGDVVRILRNVRSQVVVPPEAPTLARLVIFEATKRPGRSGRLARYADILMMMTVNGEERDEAHWRRLAGLAGWRVHKVYDVRNSWASAIELRPV